MFTKIERFLAQLFQAVACMGFCQQRWGYGTLNSSSLYHKPVLPLLSPPVFLPLLHVDTYYNLMKLGPGLKGLTGTLRGFCRGPSEGGAPFELFTTSAHLMELAVESLDTTLWVPPP